MSADLANIYGALAELAEPVRLSGNWDSAPVDEDCRRLTDAQAVLPRLLERFSAEALVAAGVAGEHDGVLSLAPKLTVDHGGLIFLRNREGDFFDVITGDGCLSGATPVLRAVRDRETAQRIDASEDGTLFVVSSMADAAFLRLLGLAVAPTALLDRLRLSGLRRLQALVGGRTHREVPATRATPTTVEREGQSTQPLPSARSPRVRLVIVAGSIAALNADIPRQLVDVARRLAGAQHLGFDWLGIDVWLPTSQELECLRYGQEIGSIEAVRLFFRACQPRHLIGDIVNGLPPPPPTPSLAEHYLGLTATLRARPDDRREVRAALNVFVDEHIVRPVVEKALQESNPDDCVALLEVADLVRLRHQALPVIQDLLVRSAADVRGFDAVLLPPEVFRQFDRLGERLHKLLLQYKSLKRRRRAK